MKATFTGLGYQATQADTKTLVSHTRKQSPSQKDSLAWASCLFFIQGRSSKGKVLLFNTVSWGFSAQENICQTQGECISNHFQNFLKDHSVQFQSMGNYLDKVCYLSTSFSSQNLLGLKTFKTQFHHKVGGVLTDFSQNGKI